MGIKFKIKILIPTLGRETLPQVITDILSDAQSNCEIIVIADGTSALNKINKMLLPPNVKITNNKFKKGIPGSLNTGLELIEDGDLFFIFSDDDVWLPGKIQSLTRIISENNADIAIGRSKIANSRRTSIRPLVKYSGEESPIYYLYSHPVFLKNPHYLSLTSMCFNSRIAEVKFCEKYDLREDIVWLNEIFKNNFRFHSIDDVVSQIEIGYLRTSNRENDEQIKLFTSYLKMDSNHLFRRFAIFHAPRSLLRQGRLVSATVLILKYFKASLN